VDRVREMQGSLVDITTPSGTGIYRLIEVHEQAGNMFIEAQPLIKTSDAANGLVNEADHPVKLINMNHVVSLELRGS